ncbi:DUF2516 family protein [uncultured Jatrophihabitans sp.]|uniref:DUF2516 family protein n=1 Tax=uncultured Jatrophihabitans sp. TaxID=1610747 RepID=UPI0035CA357B
MDAVSPLYYWTYQVLFWAAVALRAWALLDCLTRKAAAFPAVDKLTKPAWLLILVVSGVVGTVAGPVDYSPLSLISIVVASVYLADVRPAVREITSGR